MRLFLAAFFTVYGLMHLYVFMKARAALAPGWAVSAALALFMAVMFLAPLIVWYLEKEGFPLAARVASHAGYTWLGFAFLFVSASLCLDIYLFLATGAGLALKKDIMALVPSARAAFFVPLAFAALASFYGYFEAWDIRAEKVTIKTSKLPPGVERLRVVQISDVHVGLVVREKRLKKVLGVVRGLEPDILVSTGDLVDGQINNLPGLAELLHEVTPRYGKYAITGNHEFYAGLKEALAFTERAGFKVLRGEAVSGVINIAGVEDPTARYTNSERLVPEEALLRDLPKEKFTLLLKHRPVVDEGAKGKFDLQLSGHTHRGQLFPFYLATLIFYPTTGRHDMADGSAMYLSRGTGTWGPPVRFLAPPEVTLIEIVRE